MPAILNAEPAPRLVPGLAPITEITESGLTYDITRADLKDGKAPWTTTTTTHRQELVDCPDCNHGTFSIGGVLVCSWLPVTTDLLDGTPGDLIACGRTP